MDLSIIGIIVNTHGLNGTLKVKSFTDFKKERYSKGTPLYIAFKNEYIPVTVLSHKEVKTLDILTFNEFSDGEFFEVGHLPKAYSLYLGKPKDFFKKNLL